MKMHIGIDFSPWPSLGRCNELSHAPTRPCTCPTLCRSDSVSLPSTPCGQHARAGGRGSLDPPWSWVPSFLHSTLSSWLLVPVLAEQSQTCLASCSSWHLCLDLVLLLEAMALSSCRGAECLDVGTAAAVTRFSDGSGGILNGKQVTLNGQMKHIHDVLLCFCEMVFLVPLHNSCISYRTLSSCSFLLGSS